MIDLDELETQGFAVAGGALSLSLLNKFKSRLSELIRREGERYGGELVKILNPMSDDEVCNGGLIALRTKDPEAMRRVVDTAKISHELMSVLYAPAIADIARLCIPDANESGVLLSYPNFRADLPATYREEEDKFSLPWHQESGYYKKQASATSSLVFHMTLFDCFQENGALEVKPKTHMLDEVEHASYFKDEVNKRHHRVAVSDPRLNDYPTDYLETRPGDVGVFKFQLFHRSGVNTSNKMRYSLLIRASSAGAKDLVI